MGRSLFEFQQFSRAKNGEKGDQTIIWRSTAKYGDRTRSAEKKYSLSSCMDRQFVINRASE